MLKWAAKQRVCCTALALQRIRENRSQWVSDRKWRRRTSLRETKINKRSFSREDGGAEPAGPIPDLMIYGSKPRWNGEERAKKKKKIFFSSNLELKLIFRLRFKQMSCLQVNETCLSQSHLAREWIRAGSISTADEKQMNSGVFDQWKEGFSGCLWVFFDHWRGA